MLYSERKRLKEIKAKEDAGHNLWTQDIPIQLRYKIERLISSYGRLGNEYDGEYGLKKICEFADSIFAAERGQERMVLIAYLKHCEDSVFPDILESFALSIRYYSKESRKPEAIKRFHVDINKLLESYRVAYSLENCEITEFSSRELHVEVVQPVLKLLTTQGWENAEVAYQEALKEISNGNYSDAVTDATTALQEALRLVGCEGDDFASLLKSAKKSILQGFDNKYIDAIDSLIGWCSAARSKRGDSHKVVSVDKDDAWFVVHIVGILILRLSKLQEK